MKPNYNLNDTSSGIHRVVIRSARQTAGEQRHQPVTLRLEPLFRLLLMLHQSAQRNLERRSESSLPPGCALVVRYHSH